jgi:hypothetical protein
VIWNSNTFYCYRQIFICFVHGVNLHFCVVKVLGLDSCFNCRCMTILVWTWCTIHDIFMLCFVYAMTLIIIGIIAGVHNNWSKVQCLGYNKTLHPTHWTLPQFIRCNLREVILILFQMTCKKERKGATKLKNKNIWFTSV